MEPAGFLLDGRLTLEHSLLPFLLEKGLAAGAEIASGIRMGFDHVGFRIFFVQFPIDELVFPGDTGLGRLKLQTALLQGEGTHLVFVTLIAFLVCRCRSGRLPRAGVCRSLSGRRTFLPGCLFLLVGIDLRFIGTPIPFLLLMFGIGHRADLCVERGLSLSRSSTSDKPGAAEHPEADDQTEIFPGLPHGDQPAFLPVGQVALGWIRVTSGAVCTMIA